MRGWIHMRGLTATGSTAKNGVVFAGTGPSARMSEHAWPGSQGGPSGGGTWGAVAERSVTRADVLLGGGPQNDRFARGRKILRQCCGGGGMAAAEESREDHERTDASHGDASFSGLGSVTETGPNQRTRP